jgi:hypothetical protein
MCDADGQQIRRVPPAIAFMPRSRHDGLYRCARASAAGKSLLEKETVVRSCLGKVAGRWGIALAATAVLVAGCDLTGEYERRFQETLRASGEKAVFDQQLYAADTGSLAKEGPTAASNCEFPYCSMPTANRWRLPKRGLSRPF